MDNMDMDYLDTLECCQQGFDDTNYTNDPNDQMVELFCKEMCFNEQDALRVVCGILGGIDEMFKRGAKAYIKKTAEIARIKVYTEKLSERVQRCREFQLRQDPACASDEVVDIHLRALTRILNNNGIDVAYFANMTFLHLTRRLGKKNHLFFHGPADTGKTMIMQSLAELHYNVAYHAGLTLNKSFKFSSLVHVNACYMDECKLTDSQFEQWKLLAAGLPLYTEDRRPRRHRVDKCVLYSSSRHDIGALIRSAASRDAVHRTTVQFNFTERAEFVPLSVFVWDKLWAAHGLTL